MESHPGVLTIKVALENLSPVSNKSSSIELGKDSPELQAPYLFGSAESAPITSLFIHWMSKNLVFNFQLLHG